MSKRFLCMLLVCTMLLTIFPLSASATEADEQGDFEMSGWNDDVSMSGESDGSLNNAEIGTVQTPEDDPYVSMASFLSLDFDESFGVSDSDVGEEASVNPYRDDENIPYEEIFWLQASSNALSSGDFSYTLEDASATITGYMGTDTTIIIPSQIDGNPVIAIGDSAFLNNKTVEAVEIPEGMLLIGETAFKGCANLLSVSIPTTLTTLKAGAFESCTSLTSIFIPAALNSLYYYTGTHNGPFAYCSALKNITFENGTTRVLGHLFAGCTGDLTVVLPDSVSRINLYAFYKCTGTVFVEANTVTTVGTYAFANCTGTLAVSLPMVSEIESYAFSNSTGLSNIDLPTGLSLINESTFLNCSNLLSVVIPEGVTEIGETAFKGCTKLTSAPLPSTLTTLNAGAFESCSSLTSIHIPSAFDSLYYYTSTHNGPFAYCASLRDVTFDDGMTYVKNHLFAGCTGPLNIDLPDSITSIGSYAFYGCTGLESIDMPLQLEKIHQFAFMNCKKLTNVQLPNSVTSLGFKCFSDCSNLSSINIPFSWAEAPSSDSSGTVNSNYCGHIFQGCKSLTEITIPEGMTIPSYGLCYSDYLVTVHMPSAGTQINNHTFYGCSRLETITVPQGVTSIGKSAFCYCSSLRNISLPEDLTALALYAFNGCSSLKNIHLPDAITSIGWQCFADCSSLTNINLPLNWSDCPSSNTSGTISTDYCGHIFQGCKNLTTLTVPDGLTVPSYGLCYSDYVETVNLPENATEIKNHTFYGCAKLKNINIPETLTYIGRSAFCQCSSLETFSIPSGIREIISYTFYQCSGLKKIDIPDTVENIYEYAFDGCKLLKEVIIPDSVTGIGYHAFANCVNLTDVRLSRNWNICLSTNSSYSGTSYQGGIFNGCTSLLSITVPDGVTMLPAYAFSNCNNLKSVRLPDSLAAIPSYAFYGCSQLLLIQIPSGVSSISDYAFYGCSAAQMINISDGLQTVGNYAFYNCGDSVAVNYAGGADAWSSITFGQRGNTPITNATPNCDYNFDATFGLVKPTSLGNCFYSSPDSVSFSNFYGGYCGGSGHSTIDVNDAFLGLDAYDLYVSIPKDSYVTLRFPHVVYFANDSTLYLKTTGIVNERADFYAVMEDGSLQFMFTAVEDSESHVIPLHSLGGGVVGLKIVGKDLDGDSPGFDVVDVYLMAHETAVEADYNSKTSVSMTRNRTTYNLLKEEQKFEHGADEHVTLIVTPDWQNHEPGYVSVTQHGKTALQNAGGTFVDINPGKLFSPLESIYVTLIDANGNIVESLKLKVIVDAATSSRYSISTTETAITVYENKHSSTSRTDDYQLSKGAVISSGGTEYPTNEHGVAKIPALIGSSITVSKNGYVSRTITAEQLEESQKIYLQPVSDKGPVVSAVWIGNTDIRSQAYPIGLLSDSNTTLTAEVDWGSSSYGGIALMQDARTVKFTGNTLTTVLKNNFDVSSTIYIVATDAAGRSTKKALKFEAGSVSAVPNILDGAAFSISDKISITLPSNVKPDFFAGQKINVGVSSIVPVTISAEDGKVYVAIGADLVSYKKSDKWATSTETGNRAHVLKNETETFIKKFKDTGLFDTSGAASSWKKFKNFKTTYKNALKFPQGSFGFDADFTIVGFAEGYYDSQGNVTWLDGGIILNPSVSVSTNLPFALGPVPMYFEASLSADIQAQLNIRFSEAAKKFTPNGEVSGTIALSGGVGFGVKKVLYGGGGVEGKLMPDWKIYIDAQDYFKLSASVNAYAKVGLLFFEYKHSWEPFYNEVWIEYPKANAAKSASLMGLDNIYDISNYEVKDLSYLNSSSAFTANQPSNDVSLMSFAPNRSYLTSSMIKTNIYRESTPQYAQLSDGTALAVWLDSASSDVNGIQLYYSRYDGAAWSNPSAVYSDGTMDYSPYLTVINDTPYLVWQNANKSFTTSDSLDAIAPYFDISIARYDAGTGFTVNTLANPGLDMIPTLCGDGISLYAAWVNNAQNDWFGNNSANSILYSQYDGNNSWSAPVTAYSNLYSVNDLAADYNNGLRLAYVLDKDSNLSVYENGSRVTAAESQEAGPFYLNHRLYWNSNGSVICSEGEEQTEISGVGDYQIVESGGQKVLIYTTSNGLASVLNASYFNQETAQWSEPYVLIDEDTFIGSFSAAMSNDGTLRVLYNGQSVVGDYTDEAPYGTAQLSLVTLAPYCDLVMGELLYNADEYNAGREMAFSFDLTNQGSQVINHVAVNVADTNGSVLSSITVDDVIVPGQTITASTYFAVDAAATGQTVKVTAVPTEYSDINPTDNSQTAALSFEDLSVESASCGKLEDGRRSISANIVNHGYSTRSNITVEFRRDALDGETVGSVSIASLAPLSLETVSFVQAPDEECVYYVVIKDSNDNFTANDSDFASTSAASNGFAEIDRVSNTAVNLYLSNDISGICIAAVYNSDGKMLTSGTQAAAANAGEITIAFKSFALPEHYTVRVFFVDQSYVPIYKPVAREY